MQRGSSSGTDFHPDDPRSRTRVALDAGDVADAAVWAELATAEALHRIAKTIGRVLGVADSNHDAVPIERGRTRRPTEQPDSTEQAA